MSQKKVQVSKVGNFKAQVLPTPNALRNTGPAPKESGGDINKAIVKEETKQEQKQENKVAQELASGVAVDDALRKSNMYLESVLHPDTEFAARIPTGGAELTGTFMGINRGVVTTNNSGQAGVVLGYYQNSSSGDSYNKGPLVGYETNSYVVGAQTNTGATTYFSTFTAINNNPLADMDFATDNVRLVSACFDVWPIGSDYVNQGEVLFGFVASDLMRSYFGALQNISFSSAQYLPGLKLDSVSNNKRYHSIYVPLDRSAFDFTEVEQTGLTINTAKDQGAFLFLLSGGPTASTISFAWQITLNYEFIPRTTYSSVLSTASPINDSLALDHALNVLASTRSSSVVGGKPNTAERLASVHCVMTHPIFRDKANKPVEQAAGKKKSTEPADERPLFSGVYMPKQRVSLKKNGDLAPVQEKSMFENIVGTLLKVVPRALKFLL